MRISTCASLIDFIRTSTCKNDNSRHINTIDGGVGKLASTRYAHTLAVDSAQTFRRILSEVPRGCYVAFQRFQRFTQHSISELDVGCCFDIHTMAGGAAPPVVILISIRQVLQRLGKLCVYLMCGGSQSKLSNKNSIPRHASSTQCQTPVLCHTQPLVPSNSSMCI